MIEPLRDVIAYHVHDVYEQHGREKKAACAALDITWATLNAHLARYERLQMAKAGLKREEQTT